MKIIASLALPRRKFDTSFRPLLPFNDNVTIFEEVRLELQMVTEVRNFMR
jgi:hypothetical protein